MKKKPVRYSDMKEPTETSVVQEIAAMPGVGQVISVRAAKSHLSGLLEWVAAGREVVITSGGVPKVRVSPLASAKGRVPWRGSMEHLKTMPKWKGGPTAEEIVREDRDARGW